MKKTVVGVMMALVVSGIYSISYLFCIVSYNSISVEDYRHMAQDIVECSWPKTTVPTK